MKTEASNRTTHQWGINNILRREHQIPMHKRHMCYSCLAFPVFSISRGVSKETRAKKGVAILIQRKSGSRVQIGIRKNYWNQNETMKRASQEK